MDITLRYVHKTYDRKGKPWYYYRRKGFPYTRLPGDPGSPEFMEVYVKCGFTLREEDRTSRLAHPRAGIGTFLHLIEAYRNSAEFAQLAPLTRREMGYTLNKIEALYGAEAVADLERKHVLAWRDAKKATPGAANNLIRYLKVLMAFAIDRGYRNDNPVQNVKLLKVGEHRAWTNEEMAHFESKWPVGSLQRLGYALALYTGQRRADLVTLKFSNIVGNDSFRLVQQKTGEHLLIPIHPELRRALPAIYPNDSTPILAKKARKPLSPVYFGHLMARAIQEAGLGNDVVLHGLRKSAAVALIEAGCTPHQAAAITGHKTTRMLEAYAKQRDQAKLGRDAMEKWGKK